MIEKASRKDSRPLWLFVMQMACTLQISGPFHETARLPHL